MMCEQVVKDSFYAGLRAAIAAANPARTAAIRGQVRPAVVVVENELPGASVDGLAPAETFCLRWTGLGVEVRGPAAVTAVRCEIRYATEGASGGGMDRGRALAAMDRELADAVDAEPRSCAALEVSEAAGAVATGGRVFWGELRFGPAALNGERMERAAELEVYGYA